MSRSWDYHEADHRALELVNALGVAEACRKACWNAAYYATYGGADLADQQAFWEAVEDAAKKMHDPH